MITEEGEGSAQVGELHALLLAAENGATVIYTDSCATHKVPQSGYANMPMGIQSVGSGLYKSLENQRLATIVRNRHITTPKGGMGKGPGKKWDPCCEMEHVDQLAQIKVVDSDKKD